ncbi:hypothetical protein BDQ17DRAFT_1436718 [Cyathus striatus]|nr:hypothetical protein BDQ17DRAFT_1436718 [Cyathus striatus]
MFEKAKVSPKLIRKFANSIKAQVNFIKKKYFTYHKELGKTGQGLVEEVSTEKIECDFKWYLRLHQLLSTSPIYNCSGVANSSTPLDTSILELPAYNVDNMNGPLDRNTGDDTPIVDGSEHLESPDWEFSLTDKVLNDDFSDHQLSGSSPPPADVAVTPSKSKPTIQHPLKTSTSHIHVLSSS